MALGRRGAKPLAVPDHEIAQLAARIELVEKTVREIGPGHELEVHLDAGFGREILGQLAQGVGRVPSRPTKGQLLSLGGTARKHSQRAGNGDREYAFLPSMHVSYLPIHWCFTGSSSADRPNYPQAGQEFETL